MIPARSEAINNSRTVLHDDPDVTTRNGGVRRSQIRDPARRVERPSWPPTPPVDARGQINVRLLAPNPEQCANSCPNPAIRGGTRPQGTTGGAVSGTSWIENREMNPVARRPFCSAQGVARSRRLLWIGPDDRGLNLEVVALVEPHYRLVIHVMPHPLRRSSS